MTIFEKWHGADAASTLSAQSILCMALNVYSSELRCCFFSEDVGGIERIPKLI